jgi:hypothetical protein
MELERSVVGSERLLGLGRWFNQRIERSTAPVVENFFCEQKVFVLELARA